MTYRNMELVPDGWSLVSESVLTTGLWMDGILNNRVSAEERSSRKECKGESLKGRWVLDEKCS